MLSYTYGAYTTQINIPAYDDAAGRVRTDVKDIIIKGDFDTSTAIDRRIRIKLKEGMKFNTYPVLNPDNRGIQVAGDTLFKTLVDTVTAHPTVHSWGYMGS